MLEDPAGADATCRVVGASHYLNFDWGKIDLGGWSFNFGGWNIDFGD